MTTPLGYGFLAANAWQRKKESQGNSCVTSAVLRLTPTGIPTSPVKAGIIIDSDYFE
jgi:hypothetical protein